jgi:tetratricopeptide (TPR) repeat protein
LASRTVREIDGEVGATVRKHWFLVVGMLCTGAMALAQGDDSVHEETAVDRAFERMEAQKAAEEAAKAQGRADAGRVRGAMSFGGDKEARKSFDRIIRDAGSNAHRLGSLAYWLAPDTGNTRLGKYALEAYQAAIRADSTIANTWQNYASMLAATGRLAEAAQAIHLANRSVGVDPGNRRWSLNVYLALAVAEAGMPVAARILLEDIPNPGQLSSVDKPLYDNYMSPRKAGKIDLGFKSEEKGGGVVISQVAPNGLAEGWGLQVGDRIRKVNHRQVRSRQELLDALEEAGGELRFMVRRSGRFAFVEGTARVSGLRPESKALSREGVDLFQAGDLEGAAAKLREAIDLDPLNADAWFNLGLVQRSAGDAVGAATGLAASLALNPEDDETPRVQSALAAIARVAGVALPGLVSEEVAVLTESGNQYLKREEHVQALLDYLRALQKAPGAPLALFGAFSVAENMDLGALAMRLGEAYLRVFPDAPNRTKTLARLHRLRTGLETSAKLVAGQ